MWIGEDQKNTIVDLGHHNRWNLGKEGKASFERYKKSKSTLSEAEREIIRNRMIQEGVVKDSIA